MTRGVEIVQPRYCCVRTPLELAICPARRGSDSQACLRARANALKVASMMWCEFLPASYKEKHTKGAREVGRQPSALIDPEATDRRLFREPLR